MPQLFQGKKYEIEITDRAATIRMRDGGKLEIPDSAWIFIDNVETCAGFINAAVKVIDKRYRRTAKDMFVAAGEDNRFVAVLPACVDRRGEPITMKQTRIKELIVAARVCAGRPRVASALVFVVDTEACVAPYYVEAFEVVGSVEHAICEKFRVRGFFGDQDARRVRVNYWETKVETRRQVNFLPRMLKVLDVIR